MNSPGCTAEDDQIEAASRDVRRVLDVVAVVDGGQVVDRLPGPWLTQHLRKLRGGIALGLVRPCRHVGASPQPLIAVAHRPNDLLCAACGVEERRRIVGTVEDRTCDVCGEVVETIHPVNAAVGPMLVCYGACPACFPAERDGI